MDGGGRLRALPVRELHPHLVPLSVGPPLQRPSPATGAGPATRTGPPSRPPAAARSKMRNRPLDTIRVGVHSVSAARGPVSPGGRLGRPAGRRPTARTAGSARVEHDPGRGSCGDCWEPEPSTPTPLIVAGPNGSYGFGPLCSRCAGSGRCHPVPRGLTMSSCVPPPGSGHGRGLRPPATGLRRGSP